MTAILPLSLMVASLGAILMIVFRKFPQLSLLDVENIPEVKEEKKKEEFLKKHIEKKATKSQKEREEQWKPIVRKLKEIQLAFRKYVGRVERMIVREKTRRIEEVSREAAPQEAAPEKETEMRTLLNDAEFAAGNNNLSDAEKKYIAAVRLDPKNKDAYLGLGEVYRKQGQYEEAVETLRFVTQLDPSDDRAFARLAEIAEANGNTEQAIEYYEKAVLLNDSTPSRFAKLAELFAGIDQHRTALEAIAQAVELEPHNPKYLDSMAEISILVGNKAAAERAYTDLRMVNPEKEKLGMLRDRIDKMAG
ncbi:MAG: tetratricopeptide repeat protein [Candidatus Paceibacterota bacterium]|jgi:tetratricopeptide (TPR) repeat protein